MSWAAVFAGALVSLGVWLLLHLLGMGIALAAVDPQDPGTLRGAGIGTGVWSVIAPLIALFIGGLAAGRVAGPITRLGAGIHGAVLWSLTTIVSLVILVWMVGAIVSGAVAVGTTAVGATAQAVGEGVTQADADTLDAIGVDADDVLQPVNQRLQAEGLPPVTAEQLGDATRDALRTAVREGRLDRAMLTQSIADNTEMSQAEAQQVAAQIEARWQARTADLQTQLQEFGLQAQQAALEAAAATGRAMIGLFFALLLGFVAAVAGTILGVSREQRLAAHLMVSQQPEQAPPGRAGPPPQSSGPPTRSGPPPRSVPPRR